MNTSDHYDLVVVGIGGIGAAILDCASQRGLRVLGIERHDTLDHVDSCSYVSSRGFRQTYADASHRALASRSRSGWLDLDVRARAVSAAPLFFESGATLTAPSDHPLLESVQHAARAIDTPCEVWSTARQLALFPALSEGFTTLHEPAAGWIHAARALGAMTALAAQQGAHMHYGCAASAVIAPGAPDAPLRIVCEGSRTFFARAVVICTAGAHVPLHDPSGRQLDAPHTVTATSHRRQLEHWFELPEGGAHDIGMFHVIGAPQDLVCGGVLYGIPERDDLLKCCLPEERKSVRTARERFPTIRRAEIARAHSALMALLGERVAGARHVGVRQSWNVETEDGAFALGRHPRCARVWRASAFCGHGFKMFPAIAQELTDDVLETLAR